MTRKAQIAIALFALLAAAAAGVYVYRAFDQMVTTAQVVTPAQAIPAGALIEPEMLSAREVPRPLLDEAIYTDPADLVGRVAVAPLGAGMVIYRAFAVDQDDYRLVDDPELAIVSFPVDPARAVGGQIQPGHRVDVWRLVSVRPSGGITLTQMAAGTWATATLLVQDVPVVDVRARSGQAVARQPQAVPGRIEGGEEANTAARASASLQILTVGVPPQVAETILTLVAEETAGAELWVALAPLQRPEPTTAPRSAAAATPVATSPPTPAPTMPPPPTPTALPTPTPAPPVFAVVDIADALLMRDAPVDGRVVARLETGHVVIGQGETATIDGVRWRLVEADGRVGWVSGAYLETVSDD